MSTTPKDHEGFLHCPNGPSQTGRLATQGAAPPPRHSLMPTSWAEAKQVSAGRPMGPY